MVHEVPGAKFRASDLPAGRVAVMFTADWCGYCHRFLPLFKRLREGWVVDVSDEEDPLWDVHRMEVVPTVLVLEGGVEVRRWQGRLTDQHMAEILETVGPATRP